MSEEKKSSSKEELFARDINKAMDLVSKAQAILEKADGRLPKKTPKMIPAGSELSKSYGNAALQDVLKDLYHAGDKKFAPGTLTGTLEVLSDVKKLLEGECGFEF